MKKLLAAFLLLSCSVQAGMFESEPIKIFKNYPFDMHKTEFQKKFRQFGECQFNMGEDKLCADRGAEDLYGIPLNILVFFEKNSTARSEKSQQSQIKIIPPYHSSFPKYYSK